MHFLQWGARDIAQGAGSVVWAVFSEIPGKYSFESVYRNRKGSIEYNTEREPGASYSQPGTVACAHKKMCIFTQPLLHCLSYICITYFSKELNEFLAAELSLMHSRMNGEVKHSQSSQEKDVYQLEVKLDTLSYGKVPKFDLYY